MEKNSIKESQLRYFKDISKIMGIKQLAYMIQFQTNKVNNSEDMENEEEMKKQFTDVIEKYDCDKAKLMKDFEEFGKVLQSIYFEIGVQAGICLQAELLLSGNSEVEY